MLHNIAVRCTYNFAQFHISTNITVLCTFFTKYTLFMLKSARKAFNAAFTPEKYQAFLDDVHGAYSEPVTFRLGETPVFIPKALKKKLLKGVKDICEIINQPDFKQKSEAAIPKGLNVPNEDAHTTFLQLDFGICEDEKGKLTPQLIEMQGFPSLYFFQDLLADAYRANYEIPANMPHLFGGLTQEGYFDLLRKTIVGKCKPQNVILLEIEPEKQNTRVDFYGTEKHLGIKILCLSKVIKKGKKLSYKDENGKKIAIKRIYNRIIFDELQKRDDLPRQWNLIDEVDAEWVGHPNWFFRISKHTLPFIKSKFVPETHFLKDLKEIPADLSQWVLKPLFSFSGQGVIINPTLEDVKNVEDPSNFILQKKVKYRTAIKTLDPKDPVKCEIRMMIIWKKEWKKPRLVNNLIRLSKGEMVGVRYNKGKDWVGASVGFFEG
jgi:hypothetical protein